MASRDAGYELVQPKNWTRGKTEQIQLVDRALDCRWCGAPDFKPSAANIQLLCL